MSNMSSFWGDRVERRFTSYIRAIEKGKVRLNSFLIEKKTCIWLSLRRIRKVMLL